MTPAEKAKRKVYGKTRRQRLNAAMREAGIIGAPRPQMDPIERKAKRKVYSKQYRKTIQAQARAYRQLMKEGGV